MSGIKRRRLDAEGSDYQEVIPNVLQFDPNHYPSDNIFQNYAIFDTICSQFDISGINALRKVTKRWSGHLSTHLKGRWDINKKLRSFVTKPIDLRSKLGQNDALISGSFAIQFFDGVIWNESDLDIFVEDGEGAIELGRHLVEKEGYESTSVTDNKRYSMSDLVKTETYKCTRLVSRKKQHRKIQIVSATMMPVQAILRGFYTTTVVNIITWNKAYAIFPDCTFLKRKTYMLKPLDDWLGSQLSKYSKRGWPTLETQWIEDQRFSNSLQDRAQRRAGDSKTWIIALDTDGVEMPTTPDSVIEYSCFSIVKESTQGSQSNFDERSYYHINAALFSACVIPYKYTYAGYEDFWANHLGSRLDNLTKIELMKLSLDERPDAFRNPRGNITYREHDAEINKPSTWVYYDDQVLQWYKYWEDNCKRQ